MSLVFFKSLFSSSGTKKARSQQLPTSARPALQKSYGDDVDDEMDAPSIARTAAIAGQNQYGQNSILANRPSSKPNDRTPLLHETAVSINCSYNPTRNSSHSHHNPHHPHQYPSPSDSNSNTDIESQSSQSSHQRKQPWWKVDARVISDATIGLSDGLTVPFALTAGLSALGNTRVVIYGGLAELIAGAISMGLGGWLGAKSELASYKATRHETAQLVAFEPYTIKQELSSVFSPYNLPEATLDDLTEHLGKSPHLVDFMMRFQSCIEEPSSSRALTSAITIASGYFFGGLLPLLPYFFVGEDKVYDGLYISIGVMAIALFVFGYVKTCIVEGWTSGEEIRRGVIGGVQMIVVGGAAAGAAMGLVWFFNSLDPE